MGRASPRVSELARFKRDSAFVTIFVLNFILRLTQDRVIGLGISHTNAMTRAECYC